MADWVQTRLPDFQGWNGAYVAIGYVRKGILAGGVVFSMYSGANICIACALDAPLTRRFMRAIFYYPFLQLKCRRVTALVNAQNLSSRELVEHAGFKEEGCMREATPDDDVIVYGMTRAECRWIV